MTVALPSRPGRATSMASRLPSRLFRMSSVAAVALAAAACTPDYNWRQAGSVDAGARVLLPARPASMSREVSLDGQAVEMSMEGARIDKQTFTVAWLALPDTTPATRARVRAAMAAGMLRHSEASAAGRRERRRA